MSSFHFYNWNQFKVIPWPLHSVQETSFKPNTVLWAFHTIQPSG